MGRDDEFGPDTESIRAWLDKRATYAKDARGPAGAPDAGDQPATDPSPPGTLGRWPDVTPDTSARATAATPPAPGSHLSAPDGVSAGRSVLAALGVDAAQEPTAHPVAPETPDVARSVVEALRTKPTEQRDARPAAPAEPDRAVRTATRPERRPRTVAEVPAAKAQPRAVPTQVQVGRWTEPVENVTAHHASTDVDFPARRGPRRMLSLVLLAALAATGLASYVAWEEPTTSSVGIAATLGVLSLVVWAVRASATTTHLSIHRGQLIVRRGGRTETIEIGSGFTPVAILGRPGQRRWRVLIERADQPLLTITPAMVDPHWFTTSLYRIRPDLRPEVQGLAVAAVEPATEDEDASVSQAS